ncbi:MAG TPA: ABC transporter permease subunit [Ktedonobacteraceae bacterium]|nr:ABC transporter permease subunit [Ktedonobacteraceae bacterium]
MSSISKSQQVMPTPRRQESVIIGNQSYLSVLLRLISVELYKIRRRLMSKILSIVAIAVMVVFFGIISIGSIFVLASPEATFLPPPCTTNLSPGTLCLDHSPTQAELDQARQRALTTVSSPLRPPDSVNTALQVGSILGLILLIILAGTIVGGEYSVGTVRLMFTRGPTRTQFFLSKVGAILICTVLGMLVLVLIGILAGVLLNLFTGIGIDFSFFSGAWFLHTLLKLLIVMLELFVYGMLALCLSTLGRATAAGVAGALVWWGLETILGGFLFLIGNYFTGTFGNVIKAIPDYFISNSAGALSQNQDHYITASSQASTISDLQALVTLAVYLVVFIGIAWWVHQKRDVTN